MKPIETIGEFLNLPPIAEGGLGYARFAGSDAGAQLYRTKSTQGTMAVFRIHNWVITDAKYAAIGPLIIAMDVIGTIKPADEKLVGQLDSYFADLEEVLTPDDCLRLSIDIDSSNKLLVYDPVSLRPVTTSATLVDGFVEVRLPQSIISQMEDRFKTLILDALGGPEFISQYLFGLPRQQVIEAIRRATST